MFSSIDELRKNGWIQTQPPLDEVIASYNYIIVQCMVFHCVSVTKWLMHCAPIQRYELEPGVGSRCCVTLLMSMC